MSTAHPPLRKHTTLRIPPSAALTLISSYLLASTTNPSLHPDALLTESGPLASSTDGLTLHNLRRIEAGLRGDNLGADLTFSKFGGQGLPDLHHAGGFRGPIISGTGRRDGGGAEEEMEGWQDREEFEREQEVVVGTSGGRREEMMKRGKGSGVRVLLEEEDGPPIGAGGVSVMAGGDKEERKRKKKERRKNDIREKEMRRGREKDVK